MIETNPMTSRPRRALRPTVLLAAIVLLLCTLPATAGLSGAIGAGGAGHSLKETLAEATDNFGEMVSAFMKGDDERVSELAGEIKKMPGKLIKRAFPVLEVPQAIAGRLKSARQKIARFAGGVREGIADERTALYIDKDTNAGGWSDAALLEGKPLTTPADTMFAASNLKPRPVPSTTLTGTTGQGSGAASANPADSSWDFEQWVIAKQEAKPHCYGVVDPAILPAECFGGAAVGKPATPPAANKPDDQPQAKGFDWAADDWRVDGDGTSVWDLADDRYSDADREAARVSAFAADCWGVHGVSRQSGLYELMRTRMQRSDCPNEETHQATMSGDDNYLSALSDLDAKAEQERLLAEEQRRLAAEEREREAQMEAERQQERERRAAQRERERQEFNRQAAQQLGQALGDLVQTYSGGGTTSGSRTSDARCYYTCWDGSVVSYKCDGGIYSCPFRYEVK